MANLLKEILKSPETEAPVKEVKPLTEPFYQSPVFSAKAQQWLNSAICAKYQSVKPLKVKTEGILINEKY